VFAKKVPRTGFEPARDCSHNDLNVARLPISDGKNNADSTGTVDVTTNVTNEKSHCPLGLVDAIKSHQPDLSESDIRQILTFIEALPWMPEAEAGKLIVVLPRNGTLPDGWEDWEPLTERPSLRLFGG
jgi:hypothetical protein